MNLQLPPPPRFPAKALQSVSAENDAHLIAEVWKLRGSEAAVLSFFMWQWLHEPVAWEVNAMKDRVRTLAAADA